MRFSRSFLHSFVNLHKPVFLLVDSLSYLALDLVYRLSQFLDHSKFIYLLLLLLFIVKVALAQDMDPASYALLLLEARLIHALSWLDHFLIAVVLLLMLLFLI